MGTSDITFVNMLSIDINIMAMCAVYAVGGQGTIEGPGDDQ